MESTSQKVKPFIEGDKIYLREVRLSDVNERYYFWMNDPDVVDFLEVRFFPNSEEHIASYVKTMGEDPDSLFMAIILKERDEHLGNIKIGPINWIHRFADLSLFIGEKKYWGKGLASEAIRLAVDHAFNTLNLHKVTAGVYAENIGSLRAFKKAKFLKEGLRKCHRFYRGRYVDEVCLGIVRPE